MQEKKKLTFYNVNLKEGFLRHLVLRRSEYNNNIMVNLVTTSFYDDIDYILGEFKNRLLSLKNLDGKISGILHTKNDSQADAVINEGLTLLYGSKFINERILDLDFKISPFSFFQTNTLGANSLYEKVREYVSYNYNKKDGILFDLYSGTGTIAQILSPVAKKVIGVEIVAEAVEAAIENATLNKLSNCEFISNDVLKALDEIEDKPDFIVLDPPRDGIHNKALKKIIDYGVDNIIYISCKATSFARDLEEFINGGYEIEKLTCVDMFPNTGHVECIALLQRVES